MAVNRPRLAAAITELLVAIGEDPTREGLRTTPERVADAYEEFFAGLDADPVALLREGVMEWEEAAASRGTADGVSAAPPASKDVPGLVAVRELAFRSVCEHHLLPFLGRAHIAYLPDRFLAGLGRLPRVVDALAARPQVQERLTEQIADTLVAALNPRGVLVVIEASHLCVTTRGPRQTAAVVVTVTGRGQLASGSARTQALALLGVPFAGSAGKPESSASGESV